VVWWLIGKKGKRWSQASIRTRRHSQAAFVGAVHVLIRCFHLFFSGKGRGVTFLFPHSALRLVLAQYP
jgi:hypothetical protein